MRCTGQKRGFSLIEMLVVVVIIAVLAMILLPRYISGGRTADGKTVQSPKQRAHQVECWNNLNQIRQAYQMATTTEDTKPASLADLKRFGVTDEMMYCPVGGKSYPYRFDPATGAVSCIYPPHQGDPK